MNLLGWFGRRKMDKSTTQLVAPTTQMHGEIFNTVVRFLQQMEWNFQQIDGGERIRIYLTGKSILLNATFVIDDEAGVLMMLTRLPVFIPEERIDEVMRLITRINWRMTFGNYDLDIESRAVVFKSSVDLDGASDFYPVVDNLCHRNLHTIDQQSEALLQVALAVTDAEQAYGNLYPES